MSELIYLRRYNKIYKITTRRSLPDHRGKRYDDRALYGGFFSAKPCAIPCSIRLNAWMDEHPGIPSPETLMIVAADGDERGIHPFKTSYYWLTLSNGGGGRVRVSLREAARLLGE